VSYVRSTRSQAEGPAGTTTSTGAGALISPTTGAASTRRLPAGTATRYVPSAPVVALATSRPPGSRTAIVAPTTGRGAQAGSGGLRWTGQTGLAVATPTSHGPPLDGMATGEPLEPPAVGAGVGVGAGRLVGVGTEVGAGRVLAGGCVVATGPLAGDPLAAGASVGADGDPGTGVPAPAGTLQAASRSPITATHPERTTDRDWLRMVP